MSAQQIMGLSLLGVVGILVVLWAVASRRRRKIRMADATRPSPLCETCGHNLDHPVHVSVAPTYDPEDGGIVICRVQGCDCFHTWFWKDSGAVRHVPDEAEIAAIRQRFQSMSLDGDSVAGQANPPA